VGRRFIPLTGFAWVAASSKIQWVRMNQKIITTGRIECQEKIRCQQMNFEMAVQSGQQRGIMAPSRYP
jgi:hypothetical protein